MPRSFLSILLCLVLLFTLSNSVFAAPGKVFVTSTTYNGNLGGITGATGANAKCQARATAAGLPNPDSYMAWLSDTSLDAFDNIAESTEGWETTCASPTMVADNKADLIDCTGGGLIVFNPSG